MPTAVRRAVGEAQFESEVGQGGKKRWRLDRPAVGGLFRLSADELASLEQAEALAEPGREREARLAGEMFGVGSKLRALLPQEWLVRVDPDLKTIAEAQGYAFRAGLRPRVDDQLLEQLRHVTLTVRRVRLCHRKVAESRPCLQMVGLLGFLWQSALYRCMERVPRTSCLVLLVPDRPRRAPLFDIRHSAPASDFDGCARHIFGVF